MSPRPRRRRRSSRPACAISSPRRCRRSPGRARAWRLVPRPLLLPAASRVRIAAQVGSDRLARLREPREQRPALGKAWTRGARLRTPPLDARLHLVACPGHERGPIRVQSSSRLGGLGAELEQRDRARAAELPRRPASAGRRSVTRRAGGLELAARRSGLSSDLDGALTRTHLVDELVEMIGLRMLRVPLLQLRSRRRNSSTFKVVVVNARSASAWSRAVRGPSSCAARRDRLDRSRGVARRGGIFVTTCRHTGHGSPALRVCATEWARCSVRSASRPLPLAHSPPLRARPRRADGVLGLPHGIERTASRR